MLAMLPGEAVQWPEEAATATASCVLVLLQLEWNRASLCLVAEDGRGMRAERNLLAGV